MIHTLPNPNIRFKSILKEICKPINTDDIHTWARKNLILRVGYADAGPFDVSKSRYLIEPFKAVKDKNIRTVVCSAAIQTGKTLFAEICILWYLAHKNLPILFTQDSDQQIKDEVNNRLYPLMKSCRQLRGIMPEREKDFTNTGIIFPHCTLYLGSDKESSFAARSIGCVVCDEIWQYKPTMLKKAMGRVTAFDNQKKSKIILVSQPGTVGDDFDEQYMKGTQEEWSVPCLGCGEYFFPKWRTQMDSGDWRGMIWDSNEQTKREDGTWNMNELLKTVRYECEYCGFKHYDTKQVKKEWMKRGKYIAQNLEAQPDIRSFRWNSIINYNWKQLVSDFLETKEKANIGLQGELIDWFRYRMTQPYDPNFYGKGRKLATDVYDVDTKWEDEVARFMTIDCQKDVFWIEVRAWAADGRSRQLYFGKGLNDDVLKLREKFQIAPNFVFVDVGNTETQEDGRQLVYEFVDKYRYIGLRGDWHGEKNGYLHRVGNAQKREWYSVPQPIPNGKNGSIWMNFAPDQCRDILDKLRNDAQKFVCLDNQEYRRHMSAESKQPRPFGKYGEIVWRWVRNPKIQNHGWDTSVMQVVAALIHPHVHLIPELM